MISLSSRISLGLLIVSVSAGGREMPQIQQKVGITLAIVDVTLVPMDSQDLRPHQTVVVRGETIVDIGPVDEILIPANVERIDGQDYYLMPGLVDMHVHPGYPEELIVFVANGVTTIRNMWGFPDEHLAWRRQIAEGEIVGPTLFTAGPILDGSPPSYPGSEVVESPREGRRAVAEHQAAGYDFVKVLAHLKADVYDAIAEEAASREIRLVGHVPDSIDLDHALASGIASIEHLSGYEFFLQSPDSPIFDRSENLAWWRAWEFFDEARLDEIVRETRRAGVWNCPTLEVFRARLPESMNGIDESGTVRFMSPESRKIRDRMTHSSTSEERIAAARRALEPRGRVVRTLHAGGARILLGTDAGGYVVPGFSAHRELQNLVEAGLTPYEAIRTGTIDAAEFLGKEEEFGAVAVGKRADLLLVAGNPLESVANTSRILGVVLRGEWLSRAELDALLEGVADSYKRQRAAGGSQ